MSKHKFVCFECRQSVKREIYPESDVLCSSCGKPCQWIGVKIPIPPKNKIKEWGLLKEQLEKEDSDRIHQKIKSLVRRKHELEKEIQKLELLPENPGRKSLIKNLKMELNSIDA